MKRENGPLFKLLLEMKLFLTHQTKRVLASGLHLSHFYKDMRLASTCVTIIVTDCFDDFATRNFDFHISGFIRRKKALETGKCSVV